ncbi:MAG TPA: hypothetical protein VKA46_29795 [Gemmataceae bacterium]|nr:hypothetical protein [Gemmataceae bacterium]
MNPRERALAIFLIGVIILGGGGFFGYQFVYVPWTTRTRELARLQKEEQAKTDRLDEIERERGELARWRMLSLPGDPDLARFEYEKYLDALLTRHKIVTGRAITPQTKDNSKAAPTTANKEPIYTRLTFTVHAYATMDNIVAMLKDFYSTGLMHQIKSLAIQRQLTATRDSLPDELELRMTVEALIVNGTDKRPYLLPNFDRGLMALDLATSFFPHPPTVVWASLSPGLSSPGLLADPQRNYEAVARKNIFLGRAPKESRFTDDGTSPQWMAPRFVHLTDITRGTLRMEAGVYDVSTNQQVKLKGSSSYASDFPFVRDGKGTRVVSGFVVKIDDREVTYRADFAVSEDLSSREANIVRLSKADREKLVADGIISIADADAVVRVDRDYWDMLVREVVVRMSVSAPGTFFVQLERDLDKPAADMEQSFSVEVLRGKVLYQDSGYVYVRPEERYYKLHLGESLEDSLKKALTPEEVKKLKQELAGN